MTNLTVSELDRVRVDNPGSVFHESTGVVRRLGDSWPYPIVGVELDGYSDMTVIFYETELVVIRGTVGHYKGGSSD